MSDDFKTFFESLKGFPQKLVENLIPVLLIVAVGLIAIKVILVLLRRMLKKSKYDSSVHNFIIISAKITMLIFLAIIVMGKLGVQTATFIAALGAVGAAIALALKDSLGNVAGGFVIIVNKPFIKGDFIQIGEYTGNVQDVNFLTTSIKTEDGKITIIPNGVITNSILINYSRNDIRRVDCVFSIDYEDDIMMARNTLIEVGEANKYVLADPKPEIGVLQHGAGHVELVFYVWCKRGMYYDTKYSVEEDVKNAFDEAGIRCPLEKIEVHGDVK